MPQKIASAFVELRPEHTGFRNEARRAIAEALAAVNAAVPLTAEARGLRNEVRRAAQMAAAGAKIEVPVSADTKQARDALGRFIAGAGGGGASRDVKVGVKVDDRKLKALLAEITGGVAGAGTALGSLVIPPAFLQGISAATAGLVAMGGAAVAVLAPLGQLAGIIPALAVGGIAVAAGFGVVRGALSGVGDALKAYSAEQKEASTAAVSGGRSARAAAQAQEAAAEAVEAATDRLAQARENQVRDAERSAEAVADASQAVVDAEEAQAESAERSAEQIAAAQDRLLEAHDRVVDAEQDVSDLRTELADRAAEAQERYAERVEQSNEDILRAEEDLADRRIELAEDVADAQRRLDEDRLEGQERIRAAEDRIRDVQQRSADRARERRQRDQDRQRLDAARTPEERQRIQAEIDRRRAREEEADDRERAARDLKDAQDDLAKARKDAAETERRDREALADAQEAQAEGIEAAERNVTEARKEGLAVQKEGQRLARQQVEDERRIAEAVAAVEDARKAELEAQRDVGRAQLQASRDAIKAERAVEEAVESLARTRRDADRSASDAQKAVLDAERDLQRAMRRTAEVAEEAGTSGATAFDKFAAAMANLSPAGQSFVRALISAKDTLNGLRDTAAESLFPGFEAGLRNVAPLLDSLHPIIDRIGGVIGTFADKLGALLGGPESLKVFAALGEASAVILERIGDAILILIPPIGQLLVAAIPLAETFAKWAVDGAKVFAAFVDGKAKTGELKTMFENTESTLGRLFSIVGNVGGALRGLFSAAMPTGQEYLRLIDSATERMRDLIKSDAGQSGLRKFFEDSKPLVLELTGLVTDVVKGLGGIGARLALELTPVIAQLRDQLVPAVLSVLDSIDADFLSSLIGATTAIVELVGAFAQPTGALKLVLDMVADFAGFITSLLTDLGPVSTLLQNAGTAFAFIGTAIAGIKIARLISDFRGLGAVRAELAGVGTAAEGAATKVGGLGAAAKLLGLAGIFIAVKGTIDDLAPSVDKATQRLLSMPVSVKEFQKEVDKAAHPSTWEKITSQAKRNLSPEFFTGLFKPLPAEVRKVTDEAKQQFEDLAKASPQFALDLVQAMKDAGQPTQQFEEIVRKLGLGQQFMAEETAKATQKIKDQRQAAKDALDAELNLLDAVDRYSKSLEENGSSHDENTAKGRLNIRAREDLLTAVGRNIEALITDAEKNGVDAKEVEQLRGRLDELQRKYPDLSAEIGQFKNDFNQSLEGIKDKNVLLTLTTDQRRPQDPTAGTGGDNASGVFDENGRGLERGGPVTRNLPRRGPTDNVPAWLALGEYVVKADDVRAAGGPSGIAEAVAGATHDVAPGFARGGYVDFNMQLPDIGPIIAAGQRFVDERSYEIAQQAQAEYAAAAAAEAASRPVTGSGGGSTSPSGSIGGATIGSGWPEITGYLDRLGEDYTVTSTTGGNHVAGSLHYQGKAVDLVSDDMMRTFNVLTNIGSSLDELFYDPAGYSIKHGERADWIVGGHDDHVHAGTFDAGGVLEPGYNRVYNGTGARESLVPEEVGAHVGRLMAEISRLIAALESAQRDIVLKVNGREVARTIASDIAQALDDHRTKRQ